MRRIRLLSWLVISLLMVITACSPAVTSPPQTHTVPAPRLTQTATKSIPSPSPTAAATATDYFASSDRFGDGYIARIPIKDVDDIQPEEILKLLVAQWLEHYKIASSGTYLKLKDYKVGDVYPAGPSGIDQSPARYEKVAIVTYLIKPNAGIGDWYAGGAESQEDGWIRRGDVFGYFRDGDDFRLRLLGGWGT